MVRIGSDRIGWIGSDRIAPHWITSDRIGAHWVRSDHGQGKHIRCGIKRPAADTPQPCPPPIQLPPVPPQPALPPALPLPVICGTFGAVRFGAVRCGAVQCGAVRCSVAWCGVVQCGVVRCDVAWRGVVRCGSDRIGSDWIGIGSDRSDRVGSDRIGRIGIGSHRPVCVVGGGCVGAWVRAGVTMWDCLTCRLQVGLLRALQLLLMVMRSISRALLLVAACTVERRRSVHGCLNTPHCRHWAV